MVTVPKSRTLGYLLDEMADKFASRDALIDERTRLSYEKLRENVNALSKGFLAIGVSKGSMVGLLMMNRVEWIETYLALAKIGAVTCSFSTFSKGTELNYLVRHSDASTVVLQDKYMRGERVVNDFLGTLYSICPNLKDAKPLNLSSEVFPFLRRVIVLGGEKYPGTLDFRDVVKLGESVSDPHLRNAQAEVKPRDPALIIYTSGSTGTPKGVILAHYGLIENCFNIGERLHITENDKIYLPAPLFWSYGSVNATSVWLTHGACLVVHMRFDAARALEAVEKEKISVLYVLDNMIVEMINHPDREKRDLSSLRVGAGAGVRKSKRLGVDMINLYGLTEGYGFSAMTDANDPVEYRAASMGKALPGNQIKVVNPETGEPAPPGQVGELRVKGYIMEGYYKDEDKNGAAFDEQGYLVTGDMGMIDKDQSVYFKGRYKDMIKTGGINVDPAELQLALSKHPKVREAICLGVPDTTGSGKGQLICVIIIQRNGEAICTDCRATRMLCGKSTCPISEELKNYMKQNFASYKVPTYVLITDKFPLTGTEKVAKAELTKWALDQLGLAKTTTSTNQ